MDAPGVMSRLNGTWPFGTLFPLEAVQSQLNKRKRNADMNQKCHNKQFAGAFYKLLSFYNSACNVLNIITVNV